MAAQAMATAQGVVASPCAMTWQLVWCYERCHKSENQTQRQVIKKYARAAGASLVCLKKARQFSAWIERSRRPPFVLVTDWREAQPCLRAVSQHTGVNVPTHMVVLCEGRRQYMRALDWAKVLRPDIGLVHICERSAIPERLLDGVIKRCFTPVEASASEAMGNAALNGNALEEDDISCSGQSDPECGVASSSTMASASTRDTRPDAGSHRARGDKTTDMQVCIDTATRVAKISQASPPPPGLSQNWSMMDNAQIGTDDLVSFEGVRTPSKDLMYLGRGCRMQQEEMTPSQVGTYEKYVVLAHLSL